MAQNVTIAGAQYADVPAVDISKVGGGTARFVDTSDANATADKILNGYTAYANGEKITGTGTGGSPRLQAKTATANGTVTADSGYDGLSSVTVAVPYTIYRTGSGAPSSSLGDDGDLYFDLG